MLSRVKTQNGIMNILKGLLSEEFFFINISYHLKNCINENTTKVSYVHFKTLFDYTL